MNVLISCPLKKEVKVLKRAINCQQNCMRQLIILSFQNFEFDTFKIKSLRFIRFRSWFNMILEEKGS